MTATVMFLQTSFRIGGAETMWVHLIERMDRRRFRPIVGCLYEAGPLGERIGQAGVPVYVHLASGRSDVRTGIRLLRLLRRERVDLLYMMNQPATQFWGTLCGRLARVPVLMSAIHSTGKVSRIRRRLWINRLTFPWVDRVTACSLSHRAYLRKRERIDPRKLTIIPNAVDLDRNGAAEHAAGLRKALACADGEPIVGIVAMLRPEKAHEVFLRAASRVVRRVPAARFIVVGDGERRSHLEGLASHLGLDGHVQFLGARHDVPALVQLFDVGVLSSHPVVETMPLAVLEYMAAAKPVVATRVGSLPELVEEGVIGFLVGPGDTAALADRIVRLLEEPALAHRMGQAGYQKVAAQYAVDAVVRQTEALFQQLLDHKSSSQVRSGFGAQGSGQLPRAHSPEPRAGSG